MIASNLESIRISLNLVKLLPADGDVVSSKTVPTNVDNNDENRQPTMSDTASAPTENTAEQTHLKISLHKMSQLALSNLLISWNTRIRTAKVRQINSCS